MESTLSTTASQISTLQTELNGKADAGTEITGGAFSDGTLTLEKADGSSIGVDIPLPESGFNIIEITESSIILMTCNSEEIEINGVFENHTANIVSCYYPEVSTNVGLAGSLGKNIVYNKTGETTSISVSRIRENENVRDIDPSNDVYNIKLYTQTFTMHIENGRYKTPIIYMSGLIENRYGGYMALKENATPHYIYFNVLDGVATFDDINISIPTANYVINYNSSGASFRATSMYIMMDMFEKVS